MKPYLLLLLVTMCVPGCQTRDSPIQESQLNVNIGSVSNEVATSEGSDANNEQARIEAIDIIEVAQTYRTMRLITPQPVFVDPMFWTLCITPSEASDQLGPHADTAIKIYMNEPASVAFTGGSTKYPIGSSIVKEKLLLDGRDSTGEWVGRGRAVGGMVKRSAGFDTDHGDWEYFYFESPEDIEHGRIHNCIECHQNASQSDFVFGSWQFRPEFGENVKAEADVYGPAALIDF